MVRKGRFHALDPIPTQVYQTAHRKEHQGTKQANDEACPRVIPLSEKSVVVELGERFHKALPSV